VSHKVLVVALVAGFLSWNTVSPVLAHNISSAARACLKTDAQVFQGTIVDAAVATPAFSTLVGALHAANLVTALQGPGPFTVFAPTNEAFDNIPASLLQAITSDAALLTGVLTYHVAPDSVALRRSSRIRDVDSLQGQTLFLSVEEDSGRVNQSNIACQAVRTTNGTIYIIDSVLLPQF
jgi:uncharacterized surface protein with fasciclin (FAS1) repeats